MTEKNQVNYTPKMGGKFQGSWSKVKSPTVTVKTPSKPNTGGNGGNSSGNRT